MPTASSPESPYSIELVNVAPLRIQNAETAGISRDASARQALDGRRGDGPSGDRALAQGEQRDRNETILTVPDAP